MAESLDRRDIICCMCLEIFDAPKVLDCSHTFCEKCIQALITSSVDSSFIICPQCHVKIPLPEDGISSFSPAETLSRVVKDVKEDRITCLEHSQHNLSYLCEDCDVFLCGVCKAGHHSDHEVKHIFNTAAWSKTAFIDMWSRVSLCDRQIQSAWEKIYFAEQTIRENQNAMNCLLRARRETLLQMVHDAFIKSLSTLENTSKQLIARLHVDEVVLAERLQTVRDVRKSMMNTLDRGFKPKKSTASKASTEQLQQLVSNLPFHSDVQVLHFNDLSVSREALLCFMGLVSPFRPISLHPKMKCTLLFRCGKDAQTHVSAICPVWRGRVWVSYGPSASNTNGELSLFTEEGVTKKTKTTGCRVHVARIRGDWIIAEGTGDKAWFLTPDRSLSWVYSGPEKDYRLYCKLDARFYLCGHKYGKSDLRSVVIKDGSDDVPSIAGTKVCDLTLSSRPLAMDVSSNGKIIAILEEGNDNVLIFNDSEDPAPYLTYSPPLEDVNATFKPRDLCFFSFGGQERLVVADWLNDVLLVLHVTEQNCVLIGHLTDRKLLLKPTAVTPDNEGRLWIGCDGGNVLMMKQG